MWRLRNGRTITLADGLLVDDQPNSSPPTRRTVSLAAVSVAAFARLPSPWRRLGVALILCGAASGTLAVVLSQSLSTYLMSQNLIAPAVALGGIGLSLLLARRWQELVLLGPAAQRLWATRVLSGDRPQYDDMLGAVERAMRLAQGHTDRTTSA